MVESRNWSKKMKKSEKDELLSIGEFAKYSDRSIKSIRYYEQLGFLVPAYIDPESNYRYYRSTQIAILEIAQFCTELDIPLKDLPNLIDDKTRLKASDLLSQARDIAEKEMIEAQRKLNAIAFHEEQLEKVKEYAKNPTPYEEKMKERYFFTTPYSETSSIFESRKAMLQSFKRLNQLGVSDKEVFELENGIYFESDGSNVKKYYFVELPYLYPKLGDAVKTVPAGRYTCRQSYDTMINEACKNAGSSPFIAIETEIFSDPYDLNCPLWELKWMECEAY